MRRRSVRHAILYFDIDDIVNRVLPGPLYQRLPKPISHFLGHRSEPPKPLPPTIETLHAVISIFAALLCVSAITQHAPALQRFGAPPLIPSLGAGAVLNFVTISNPAAQPRATIAGQAISAAVGVGVSRLFTHIDGAATLTSLEWVAAPLAVALAALAMRLTNTVHPPGGATAALAVASADVRDLGWWLVALITLGTVVMVATACLLNNLGRRWPEFWWTEEELPVARKDEGRGRDEEAGGADTLSSDDEATVRGSVNGSERGSGEDKRFEGDGGEALGRACCSHCGRH